jgi:hypothetical protein
VEITASKINEWVQVERLRKIRADRYNQFFGRVRQIFIYLFVATIAVFVFNHHVEIQGAAYAKLGRAIKKSSALKSVQQNTLSYEKEVAEITQ